MPFTSIDDTVHDGYALQFPLEQTATLIPPLASVSGDGVVLETVKLAADRSGDLILRLYESLGATAEAEIQVDVAPHQVDQVEGVDLLERELPDQHVSVDLGENGLARAQVTLRPFSVATLRVKLK